MHLGQTFRRDASLQQVFKDMLDFARATNHTNIRGSRFQRSLQGILIKMVPACDNDNPTRFVRLQFANRLWNIAKSKLYVSAKALWIGQIATIINNNNTKIEIGCQAC